MYIYIDIKILALNMFPYSLSTQVHQDFLRPVHLISGIKCGIIFMLIHCLLQRRLQKELMSLMKEPPPGVTVDAEGAGQNLTQ
jgi:hypothetical protein